VIFTFDINILSLKNILNVPLYAKLQTNNIVYYSETVVSLFVLKKLLG